MYDADVFAHSHGCNITMATTRQTELKSLILLSCPVHRRFHWPNFSNVNTVISIRIKWDFVIMVDRGGQRFNDERIEEKILPICFTAHNESRQSATWKREHLDSWVDQLI